MKFKRGVIALFLVGMLLFISACSNDDDEVTVKSVFDDLTQIGSLEAFGVTGDNALIGFMRILVAILVFAILFEVGSAWLSRNIAITLAIILAIMSSMFIPGKVLAGIGGAYATLISLVLIGAPVVGGLVAIHSLPNTRPATGLKIVILVILLWILMAVKTHAGTLMKAGLLMGGGA